MTSTPPVENQSEILLTTQEIAAVCAAVLCLLVLIISIITWAKCKHDQEKKQAEIQMKSL